MTKKEFEAKMNKKNLGEIAEEKVAAFLTSGCEDVDVLFNGIEERILNPEDAEYIRSVLAEVLDGIPEFNKKRNHLMSVIRDSSDAMSTVFLLMMHKMRQENDYSGLGLLYEACSTDLPFRIYQWLGDMIFNDRYLDGNLQEREKESPLFRVFYDRFNDYYGDLITRADTVWESYLQPADVDDDEDNEEDKGEELSYERFQQMIADSEDEDDIADDLMPSTVQLRVLKSAAYLMALAGAVKKVESETER